MNPAPPKPIDPYRHCVELCTHELFSAVTIDELLGILDGPHPVAQPTVSITLGRGLLLGDSAPEEEAA